MVKKIISICAAGMIVASCSPKKTTAQPTDPWSELTLPATAKASILSDSTKKPENRSH